MMTTLITTSCLLVGIISVSVSGQSVSSPAVFPFNGPPATTSTGSGDVLNGDTIPAGSLIARIHGQGVLGYVLFSPESSSSSSSSSSKTIIKARITSTNPGRTNEVYNWKIHSFPQQMSSLGCSAISIGPVILDLSAAHGPLASEKEQVITSSAVTLAATDSVTHILGRSLVLHGLTTGSIICATILPAGHKSVYEAKLHSPISGSIKVIQTTSSAGILAEYMMYSNGARKSSSHKFAIVSDVSPESIFANERSACKHLVSGSSTRPLGSIAVSTEMPGVKGRSYQVLNHLRQLEADPINYVVVFDDESPNEVIACAPLHLIRSKSAQAKFTQPSPTASADAEPEVEGTITLTQDSPFDPTKIETNLNLNVKAYSYGIDLLPTIRRRRNEAKACPNIKETIYNPFFKDPEEIPTEGHGTTDQFAVGDLSGKFGTLQSKQQESFTSWDFNLPLFGQFSVIGRAVVVYAPEGPAVSCANFEVHGTNITTAYSTFDVPLQGQFIFRQPVGECNTDTYVYIEISKPDGADNKKSFNHPWHIHQNAVNAGFDHLSSTECQPAGGHLNPFNVSTDCIYQRDCTMFTPLRCEVGDASGKLGPIDIPTYKSGPGGEPDVAKYYFVDTDLSLCGGTSIVGRSVVIHQPNFHMKRFTCANILEFKPRN